MTTYAVDNAAAKPAIAMGLIGDLTIVLGPATFVYWLTDDPFLTGIWLALCIIVRAWR